MDSFTLASLFNKYFITKIADIRNEFPVLESDAVQLSVTDFNAHSNVSHTSLTDFIFFIIIIIFFFSII